MKYKVLTKDNIKLYAITEYDNPFCSGFEEFEEDFRIPKYIKKLFNKYVVDKELKERLILNHIISFYNLFGQDGASRILFFRIDEEHYSILKTFLIFLGRCPDKVDLGNKIIYVNEILMDENIINILRKI